MSAPTKACRLRPRGFSPGKGNLSLFAVKEKGTRKQSANKVRVLNDMNNKDAFQIGQGKPVMKARFRTATYLMTIFAYGNSYFEIGVDR